jgi:hypothetical protein
MYLYFPEAGNTSDDRQSLCECNDNAQGYTIISPRVTNYNRDETMRSVHRTVAVSTNQFNPHMIQISKHKFNPLLQADDH